MILLLVVAGCREYADHTPRPAPPTTTYPTDVRPPHPHGGGIRGRVIWDGDRPEVPPIAGLIVTPDGARWGEVPNPFTPMIADDGGVAGAVVWLSPIRTPDRAWPYPPLVLEHTGDELRSVQPGVPPRVGFVRVGDAVELVARGMGLRLLRARGAAFFTFAFPEADKPRRHPLDTLGVVEFTSATGDFWNTVDVVVCEHPYYAATNKDGQFEWTNLPPGEYDLTVRVRNWAITGRDRDPETGRIMRLTFAEPKRFTRRVTIVGGEALEVDIRVK
ncbi:MAG: hypothetical protein MUF18_05810 [Fimbriiglobus sp.]|nr:hypothetical protein [Fimbriiglobus sp.]